MRFARLCSFALACASFLWLGPAAADTIRIGLILTLSGPNASLGQQIDNAVKLYVKLHEKDILPHKVEIITRDDTGPAPDVARRLAQELVTRDKVNILAGVVFTPNAHAIAPVATEAKVPFILMNAAGSVTTTLSPMIARVSFTQWQLGVPMGQWAAKSGMKTAYTLVTDFAPGHDAEGAFVKGFTTGGGKVIASDRMPIQNPDFGPFMQRVKDAKADAVFVFVPAGRQATAIMKAYRERGLPEAGIKLIGPGDITTDEELPNMGEVAVGVVTAQHYSAAHDSPENKAFVAAWKKEYGPTSTPNFMSAGGWDGMAAIFHIIKALDGKVDGDKAIAALKGWKATSPRGPIMIDPETRDIVQNVYIRRVEKRADGLANVEFDTIPMVKDPWKEEQGKK